VEQFQTSNGARAGEAAQERAPWARPLGYERLGIWLFFGCVVVFGAIVEMRSAFLTSRMTDLDVYLRAAWAVRTGRDPYAITDDRGWHYHYPPLFAIALIPLADPPPAQSRGGMVPFKLAVAVWYVLNLLLLAFAVNNLASALERAVAGRSGIPPPGCRSWWSLRLLPVLVCIAPIGVAMERGQADLLLLALLCAMIGAILAGRSFAAGWWLAGAICLKLFPLYLLVYPLWRRDRRLMASCALGLALGLVLIPAAFFGPAKALSYAQEWNQVLIQPALLGGADRSRAGELLDINATDNQSFVALIHRWRNLGETIGVPRPSRSRPLEPWATTAHWTIGLLLTAAALLAAGRRRRGSPIDEELFLGSLVIIMVLSSPVSHLHYFTLTVPLAMGLVMTSRNGAVYPQRKSLWLLAAFAAASALPLIPGLEALRDLGLASFGALALWCAGTITVWRGVQAGSRL
jgi:hypothetical protein